MSLIDNNIYVLGFAMVGLVVVCFFLMDMLWGLLQASRAILAPYMIANEEDNTLKKYGEWALVTGCTDGLGKEYSKQLAKRGHSVVLVSRSLAKLTTTAKEIETKYSVKTKIIVADFSDAKVAVQKVKDEVGKLQISILVNNVGSQYTYPMYLNEVPEHELHNIINVNIGAVTLLTRHFIEDMSLRNKGAIVNVSSGSELMPLPLMTVYAASKAYIKSFTTALRYEYSDKNITIQHLSPMFVATKMNLFSGRLQKTSVFVPNAESFAKYAVATLGKMDHSTGYWSHGIQYFFVSMSPVWIRTRIGGLMNKSFRNEYFQANKGVL